MRIIIAGGTGMIGRPLSATLAKSHDVFVLSRNPANARDIPTGVTMRQWDAVSGDGWSEIIDANTVIINLAGENIAGSGFFPTRWSPARKELLQSSRVRAGKAIVDGVRQAAEKPKAVLQSSGVGYYGALEGDKILTEEAPAGDDFLAKLCIEWEASSAPVTDEGVRHIIMRTGIVLNPNDGALKRLLLPYKLFTGGPFGNGRQWWPWIHPVDTVEAIAFLAQADSASGIYNVCAPNPLQNKQFGKILGKQLNRPSLIPLPSFALKLALGEVATVVVDGQRAIPSRLTDDGFMFQFAELAPALADLLNR